MKLYKFRLSAFFTTICSALLSLLGFGCSSDPDNILCMYGSPTGDFVIKGAVTDEDGNEVSDAVVRVTHPNYPFDRDCHD